LHPYAENFHQFVKADPGILIPDGLLDGLADVEDGAENFAGESLIWTDPSGKEITTGTILNGTFFSVQKITGTRKK
jgi:hypothetical protein